MKREELNIDYSVYKDGVRFLGTTQVTLPNIGFKTLEMSGAGIAGTVESVVLGHLEQMSMTMNFRTLNKEAISLTAPAKHTIDLRAAVQENDTSTGAMKAKKIKNVLVVIPKTMAGGTYQPANPTDTSVEFAVSYWKQTIDGEVVLEIDPLNYICSINGVDYLKDVRDALGY